MISRRSLLLGAAAGLVALKGARAEGHWRLVLSGWRDVPNCPGLAEGVGEWVWTEGRARGFAPAFDAP